MEPLTLQIALAVVQQVGNTYIRDLLVDGRLQDLADWTRDAIERVEQDSSAAANVLAQLEAKAAAEPTAPGWRDVHRNPALMTQVLTMLIALLTLILSQTSKQPDPEPLTRDDAARIVSEAIQQIKAAPPPAARLEQPPGRPAR